MTVSLTLIVLMAVLYAAGAYLLLARSLSRILIGVLLVGNATNLLLLVVAGDPGDAPIVTDGVDTAGMTDPLTQGLTLTAIVITFGMTALLLALVHRSWRIARQERTDERTMVPGSDAHADDEGARVAAEAADDDRALHKALDASDEDEDNEDGGRR